MQDFLDSQQIKYLLISHSPAYTSQEIAASAHMSGKQLAKTVIVELDGRLVMAVLPANKKILVQDLSDVTGSEQVRFATEEEFKNLFPDCDVGATPLFGKLYGMDVYVAQALAEDEEIVFNAGSHTELLRMSYRDFERLVNPMVMSFTT